MGFFSKLGSKNHISGLSLIDITILMLVVSLLLLPILKMMDIQKESDQVSLQKGNISALADALNDYAIKFGRYPAPADPSLPMTDINVFRSITGAALNSLDWDDCEDNTSSARNFYNVASPGPAYSGVVCKRQRANAIGGHVLIGSVPVSELGLPNSAALDEFARKYTYIVSGNFVTDDPAANPPPVRQDTNNNGRVIIENELGIPLLSNAHFGLISHGQNGVGAFGANGQKIGGNTCLTNTADARNMHACRFGPTSTAGVIRVSTMDGSGTPSTTLKNTPSLATGVNYYDDVVAYRSTILNFIWSAKSDSDIGFSLSNNVGIGYPEVLDDDPDNDGANWDTEMPRGQFSVTGGNILVKPTPTDPNSGRILLNRICDEWDWPCFRPENFAQPLLIDATTSNPDAINCSDYSTSPSPPNHIPLNGLDDSDENLVGDCETVVRFNRNLSTCPTGIARITSAGVVTCNP